MLNSGVKMGDGQPVTTNKFEQRHHSENSKMGMQTNTT